MHPHSWASLSPLATELSLWVTSQLGEISALSAGLACRPQQARDRHPLVTACNRSSGRGNRLGHLWVERALGRFIWASLPPPAGLRSIPHTRSVPPFSWASLPPPARPVGFCIQVGRDVTLVIHLQNQRSVCLCFSHCAESVSLL